MTIWAITLALNIALALILLFHGHYVRYKILFASLVYEIFAASVLHYILATYGVDSSAYDLAYRVKKAITISFLFGIIFEGFRWRNSCIRVPCEIYLGVLLCVFLADKGQFFTISYVIYEGLRYANISIILWWIYCFKRSEYDERKQFRAP